jgi:Plasmid encoded RepA protein
MADNDNPQLNLGGIIANLPAVRAARRANLNSRVHCRLIEPVELTEQDNETQLSFQHTVFCQTSLPYRNPGDEVRLWQRSQGTTMLVVHAGQVLRPREQKVINVGLPWGPKPRLILAHLNAEALRQQSPVIEVESSLSAFVKRIRGFQHGREIRAFKDQLTRISNASFQFATALAEGDVQTQGYIIDSFKLWPEKDERQRVLWPSTIEFSIKYFESLQEHAVPLNEADLAALAHSAMALDIYSWLAQRLHRINPNRSTFIQWPALKAQFGHGYDRMDNFKGPFRKALRQVYCRYKAAKFEIDSYGMRLFNSPPPVAKRLVQLP